MRLFIAFDVSSDAKRHLIDIQNEIKKLRPKISYPTEFHQTLKFLGEVEDSGVPKVIDALSKIKYRAFKINLHELGTFSSSRGISVVWVGLSPDLYVNELHDLIEDKLKDFGTADVKFSAHITLGRVKFVKNKKWFLNFLEHIKVEKISFEVNSFKLIRSTLTSEGPVYEVVKEFVLI